MMSGYKSPRELAESHFNTPAPSARDRAFGELEAVKADRDEKTRQLREARLARDAQDTKKPCLPVHPEQLEAASALQSEPTGDDI